MTQEDKQLLLVDLCARLPYGVKGRVYAECSKGEYDINGDMIFFDSPFDVTLDDINISTEEIHVIAIGNEDTFAFIEDQQTWGSPYTIDEFKPYLRPLSSMTEEEKKEYQSLCEIHFERDADDNVTYYYFDSIESIDWLNKKMFDYRGLIDEDLAIEVTKDNNPYENQSRTWNKR